ncbi:hypothetical protein [Spiroplasma endosymbiont of Lasioglossum villosulum]|uniref:hypothetical protein n=1 Tax=Spiroplasma endosymbiont of Lasioglossum villosulum TaxID=3066320 RepID=UPI0030CA75AA
MDKEKPFSCKDQKIINEYNKKRNQEITKEHLNNIEKLREDFKKEVINQYKKNLICSLNIFLGHYIEQYKKEKEIYYLNKLKGSVDTIELLINKIKSKEFD